MGRSECGKTTISRHLQSHFKRVVIFDTIHEYADGVLVWSLDQLFSVIEAYETKGAFRIIYRLDPLSPTCELDFELALQVLYEWGGILIVFEEVQELATAHHMPATMKRMILTGRHQNIALLFTTQRPGELHKTMLSQCGHVFTGQLHDQNDVRYVAGYLGREARELVNLPPYHFLYFRPGDPIIKVTLDGSRFRVLSEIETIESPPEPATPVPATPIEGTTQETEP